MKSEILNGVAQIVCEETEIPLEKVISNSKQINIVDARFLLVHFLHRKGFYVAEISAYMCMKKRSINRMISTFDERVKTQKMIRFLFERVKTRIGDN